MLTPAQSTNLGRLSARAKRTTSLTFALDLNEGAALTEARSNLLVARTVLEQFTSSASETPAATLSAAQRHLDDAQEAYDALVGKAVTFTVHLRAIEVERLDELEREHPPTQQQIRQARVRNSGNPKGDPAVNVDTYLPALLVEVITAIEMSDDPANPLRGTLALDQVEMILAACPHHDRVLLRTTAETLSRSSTHVDG